MKEDYINMEYFSKNGYVFKNINTEEILGNYLSLSVNDNIRNYTQILKPIQTDASNEKLSDAISKKCTEINSRCQNKINNGIDYKSSSGLQHYSLSSYDQTNIIALGAVAQAGKSVPYHADNEICRAYDPQEFLGLVEAVTNFVTYHTTYNNLLKHQIKEMTDIDEINCIIYEITLLNDKYAKVLESILSI